MYIFWSIFIPPQTHFLKARFVHYFFQLSRLYYFLEMYIVFLITSFKVYKEI